MKSAIFHDNDFTHGYIDFEFQRRVKHFNSIFIASILLILHGLSFTRCTLWNSIFIQHDILDKYITNVLQIY